MWVSHLIAATVDRRHAGHVQGPIAHAPGDTSDKPIEYLLTTCTPGVNEANCSEHRRSQGTKCLFETTDRHDQRTQASTDDESCTGPATSPGPTSTTSSSPGATRPGANSPGSTSPGSRRTGTQTIDDRLATIETTLRIQDATGTSHLQQLEMDPEAHGVAKSSRPLIKNLRLQRNRALHGAKPVGEPPPCRPGQVLKLPAPAAASPRPRSISRAGDRARALGVQDASLIPDSDRQSEQTTSRHGDKPCRPGQVLKLPEPAGRATASSRPHGNKFDEAIDSMTKRMLSYDPAFQCPVELSPKSLVVHLAGKCLDEMSPISHPKRR